MVDAAPVSPKAVTEEQLGLLRVLSRHFWARPGQCKCRGYSHPIGASNGLKGLVSAGLASWRWSPASRSGLATRQYQITSAGMHLINPPQS